MDADLRREQQAQNAHVSARKEKRAERTAHFDSGVVEASGFEPPTSAMRTQRSPD
jgi:hypothetical protein